MNTEYEVRVLEIDALKIEKQLEDLGAVLQWDHLQKRYVYDFIPKIEGKWIRLRTNGDKTTLTIKNIVSSEIDGTQELEIEGKSEEAVYKVLDKLNISKDSITTRDVEGVYLDYGYQLDKIYNLRLEEERK